LAALEGSWQGWAGSAGIPVGTPYLISPSLEYDVELNRFFCSADMLGWARRTSSSATFSSVEARLVLLLRHVV